MTAGSAVKRSLLAAALCLAAAPARAAEGAAQPYTEGKYFTVAVPAGWTKKDEPLGLSDAERKVFGAEFFGPQADGIAALVGARYYAPGNQLQPTAEKFIKVNAAPALGINTSKEVYGKVTAGKAGNYYAKTFERKSYEYMPKEALHPKKVHIYEKFYVVPVKNGFYVLHYYAPMDLARANLRHFEDFVASFKPLTR